MRLRPLNATLSLRDCHTRIPFRFGVSTMTAAPLALVRVDVETDHHNTPNPITGYASDLLVPKWFDKNPQLTNRQETLALLDATRDAIRTLLSLPPDTPFQLWRSLYTALVEPPAAAPPLVRNLGVSLVERALIDAACRAAATSFEQALTSDLLAFRPQDVAPELDDWNWRRSIPAPPRNRMIVRHTVGLLDPLRADDIEPDDRTNDGLPQSLDEDITRYGLRAFKLKVAGDIEHDVDRLLAIERTLDEHAPPDRLVTLDGNEQYASIEELATLVDRLALHEEGRRLLAATAYIEQPIPRASTFEPERLAGIDRLPVPVIIDEADATTDAFSNALALGYRGCSVKNCKGVFRAMINKGACELHADRHPDQPAPFQTCEDLTNLPVIALQQDLASAAALGLDHAERNGHHYFRALKHLPSAEADDARRKHPDLYNQDGLRITDGTLSLDSLRCNGYAYDIDVQHEQWTPVDQWSIPE